MDLATATPVEVDTEIARLQGELASLDSAYRAVAKKIDLFVTDNHMRLYVTETPEELNAKRVELGARMETLRNELDPLRAEYTRRPWARYWRVDNSNGHVHTSIACRNTRETTAFGWLPQVSGFTPEQVVELAGKYTCLTCFPTVREEILAERPCLLETANQRVTREEREARDAEKAAKLAAKAAKAITNPDGSPLRLKDGFGAINTVRTAEMEYVNEAAQLKMYQLRVDDMNHPGANLVHPDYMAKTYELHRLHSDNVLILLTALAHKLGTTVEEQRERFAKKVTARYNRDWR